MVPLEALTRYSKEEDENGPPSGPEAMMPEAGVITNEGGGDPAEISAMASDVSTIVSTSWIS